MYYSLSPTDITLCNRRRNKTNQLAFGIMISYFQTYLTFPSTDNPNISVQLTTQIAKELDIELIYIETFNWSGRNAKRYRQEIREYLGYRVANTQDAELIASHLVDNLIPSDLSDSVLLDQTRAYFVKHKIEIVSIKQLENYISAAKHKFEERFLNKIFDNLTQENLLLIDLILDTDSIEDSNIIGLSELKQDIAGAKIKNVQRAIDKINLLGQINLSESIVDIVVAACFRKRLGSLS